MESSWKEFLKNVPENREDLLNKLAGKICKLYKIRFDIYSDCSNEDFKTKMFGIHSEPATQWICDWIQNIINSSCSENIMIDRIKADISNSEDLSIQKLKEMIVAADKIIEFLNRHNSYATGNLNHQPDKGEVSQGSDEPLSNI